MRGAFNAVAGMFAAATMMATGSAWASEGAASDYFPGAFGSFLVAVPPDAGFAVASQTLLFSGKADRAVLNGRASFGLTASAVYEYIGATYTFDLSAIGARMQIGAAAPVIATASMNTTFTTTLFGSFSNGQQDTGFGDSILTPVALFWNFGDFNVKLAEFVVAPTGHYDVTKAINVGRNYWAFDTQLGITWFHKQTGTEISFLPGIMMNTMNPATNYQTGTEFHMDFMVNQFVAPTFAVGIQSYWYQQIDGDSGSGAVLGPFMGESVGFGPAFLWTPEFLKGRGAVIAKWLHDVSNTNRLNGDWGQVTLSYKF